VLRYELSPAALAELQEAADFLEDQSFELGDSLLDEVERVMQLLCRQPGMGSPVHMPGIPAGIRKMNLQRFRYSIVYRVQTDVVQVLAVAHSSRRPTYWAERI